MYLKKQIMLLRAILWPKLLHWHFLRCHVRNLFSALHDDIEGAIEVPPWKIWKKLKLELKFMSQR